MAKGMILLVDDDVMLLALTGQMLIASGYSVIEACSGTEAQEIFLSRCAEVQLVISDVMMPGMLGDQLVRNLKKINPELKYVLISGNSLPSIETDLPLEEGINFLQKPFLFEQLKEIVVRQLAPDT